MQVFAVCAAYVSWEVLCSISWRGEWARTAYNTSCAEVVCCCSWIFLSKSNSQ